MMRHPLALALTLCCLGGGVAWAQDSTATKDSAAVKDSSDVLILDHTFSTSGEFVRVTLEALQVYRAEISSPDVELELRPLRGAPPVIIYRDDAQSSSGKSVFSLNPKSDAEYELRAIGAQGVGARVQLFRDLSESKRRARIIATPGWEIGIEGGAGYHTGYLLGISGLTLNDNDEGSWDVEGCFAARSGPSLARYMSGCALGVGWHNRPGSEGVLWIYTEPRIRFFGGRPRGESNNEIGALFRLGIGQVFSGSSAAPFMLAPGGYVTRNIRKDKGGKGWSFTLAYAHIFLHNISPRQEADRVTFAVGWYQ